MNLSFVFVLFAMVGLISSCQSDDDAREKARQSLASTDVNPTSTTTAPTPAAIGNQNAAPAQGANAAAPAVPSGPTTTMAFAETTFDFGEIETGEKIKHVYKFQNTGNEPLVISNATGSCGCTVPSWPKEPIPVGESGEILVEFDSKNKSGNQSKRVTITANTDPVNSYLTIKGMVNKLPQ